MKYINGLRNIELSLHFVDKSLGIVVFSVLFIVCTDDFSLIFINEHATCFMCGKSSTTLVSLLHWDYKYSLGLFLCFATAWAGSCVDFFLAVWLNPLASSCTIALPWMAGWELGSMVARQHHFQQRPLSLASFSYYESFSKLYFLKSQLCNPGWVSNWFAEINILKILLLFLFGCLFSFYDFLFLYFDQVR